MYGRSTLLVQVKILITFIFNVTHSSSDPPPGSVMCVYAKQNYRYGAMIMIKLSIFWKENKGIDMGSCFSR